jgi:hypothetical protein
VYRKGKDGRRRNVTSQSVRHKRCPTPGQRTVIIVIPIQIFYSTMADLEVDGSGARTMRLFAVRLEPHLNNISGFRTHWVYNIRCCKCRWENQQTWTICGMKIGRGNRRTRRKLCRPLKLDSAGVQHCTVPSRQAALMHSHARPSSKPGSIDLRPARVGTALSSATLHCLHVSWHRGADCGGPTRRDQRLSCALRQQVSSAVDMPSLSTRNVALVFRTLHVFVDACHCRDLVAASGTAIERPALLA